MRAAARLIIVGAWGFCYLAWAGLASVDGPNCASVFRWWHPAVAIGLTCIGAFGYGIALAAEAGCDSCRELERETDKLKAALIADGKAVRR